MSILGDYKTIKVVYELKIRCVEAVQRIDSDHTLVTQAHWDAPSSPPRRTLLARLEFFSSRCSHRCNILMSGNNSQAQVYQLPVPIDPTRIPLLQTYSSFL
ncbi:hypothetical protein J6590_053815 [Homalodisca vitripennis]|nr:hypothetical protein J6590_053815 [Homalodisca vitripennis]